MTGFPVTTTLAGFTPSLSKLSLAQAVGAKCRSETTLATRRLISSGGGLVFKGPGFYATDYKSGGGKGGKAATDKKSSGGTGESSKGQSDGGD